MTKERKILVAVLAVALFVWAIDSLLLGGTGGTPDSAAASDQPANTTAPATASPTAATTTAAASNAAPKPAFTGVADLLQAANQQSPATDNRIDPFTMPNTWQATSTNPAANDPSHLVTADESQSAHAAFIADHRLSAVLKTKRGTYAVINGNIVRLGQTIAGYKLIATQKRSATFENEFGHAVLHLQD